MPNCSTKYKIFIASYYISCNVTAPDNVDSYIDMSGVSDILGITDMKNTPIEDDVLAALEKLVVGFNETPSSVIRRLLEKSGNIAPIGASATAGNPANGSQPNPFSDLLKSPAYLMANAGKRYFQVLAFLHQLHGEDEFAKITTYKFGGRIYFADNAEAIAASGHSTNPKPIPGTKFFALSTLSNAAKRRILGDVLLLFKYQPSIIGQVIATMPDSAEAKTAQFVYPTPSH